MDIFKRSLAPVSDSAWEAIGQQTARTLKGCLSARKLVDFDGPRGLELGAVNLGRLKPGESEPVSGVSWGIRQNLPLVEIRIPFALEIWELDNIDRGSLTPELEAVGAAAYQAALFEEKAVYNGLEEACIQGIAPQSPHKALPMAKSVDKVVATLEKAMVTLEKSGVGGPYALVLGEKYFSMLMAGDLPDYPLKKRIEEMLRGGIHWSPALEGGLLLSRRGGDFRLTVGQDLEVGYASHDSKRVNLYVTESFTFQVLEAAAAVVLT